MAPSIRLALTLPPALLGALLPAAGRAVLLVLPPGGGQRTARRNAWAGMSAAAARTRAQREADLAVSAAQARLGVPAGPRSTAPARVAGGG